MRASSSNAVHSAVRAPSGASSGIATSRRTSSAAAAGVSSSAFAACVAACANRVSPSAAANADNATQKGSGRMEALRLMVRAGWSAG
jgi:hypothetical protein